jgi:hypothetical protein
LERILEAIFRRPLQLLAVIAFLPVLSVGIMYFLPRSYQATATLWALRRYEVIGASGPESNLLATPADTQATALTELLQSRYFALSVANATGLPSTLDAQTRADPQTRDDTLANEISKQVTVASQGYNLFVVTYVNKNPRVAQQVVQSVVQNFSLQSQGFSVVEGQRLIDSYQTELAKAKQDATNAAATESKYILDHPELKGQALQTDPQYALLHAQTQQAQVTLGNIQTTIATINQQISTQGTGKDTFFKVLDSPNDVRGVSRTKTYLTAGGVGLGIALLACVLYIIISARLDRTLRTSRDIQKVTSLPVVTQLPHLDETTMPLLIKPVQHSG